MERAVLGGVRGRACLRMPVLGGARAGAAGREGLGGHSGVGVMAWERLPDGSQGSRGSTPTVTPGVNHGSCVHGHDGGLPQGHPRQGSSCQLPRTGPRPTSGGTQAGRRGDAPVATRSPGNLAGNRGKQLRFLPSRQAQVCTSRTLVVMLVLLCQTGLSGRTAGRAADR